MNETMFEKKIKPLLKYIGFIGASISALAYIIIMCILVVGFETHLNIKQTISYSVVNAVFGLVITLFLKKQGVDLARNLEDNKNVLDKFNNSKDKDEKLHSITYYWITSTIKDILFKAGSIAISTFCLINIVIQGSGDIMLILLSIANLALFVSFGLITLVDSYDYFNTKHIAYLKNKLKSREILDENNIYNNNSNSIDRSNKL